MLGSLNGFRGFFILLAVSCVSIASAADVKQPVNAREMFETLGVERNYFDRLVNRIPLSEDENETLWRVLDRLRKFPPAAMQRWALKSIPWDKIAEKPASWSGSVFQLRGRVLEVEPIRPPEDPAERYLLKEYFRCRMQLDKSSQYIDVYTENVPDQWRRGLRPDAPGGAMGVFLKIADDTPKEPLLVFAAPRLAWYPDNLLSCLGMDYGLFDSVTNQKPISAEESEAFYQMLAAAGRATTKQLIEQAMTDLPSLSEEWKRTDRASKQQYAVFPLFNEADSQQGRLVALHGTVRRIDKIAVDDPDIVSRFGFDHYYQVFLFTDDSEDNPLTFCILKLPEGMPYGNLPRYGETVDIAGFFFKTWNYRVAKLADPSLSPGDPVTHRQLSPLLIGRSLVWHPAPKPPDRSFSNAVIVGIVGVGMVLLWLFAWRNQWHEKRLLEKMDKPLNFEE